MRCQTNNYQHGLLPRTPLPDWLCKHAIDICLIKMHSITVKKFKCARMFMVSDFLSDSHCSNNMLLIHSPACCDFLGYFMGKVQRVDMVSHEGRLTHFSMIYKRLQTDAIPLRTDTLCTLTNHRLTENPREPSAACLYNTRRWDWKNKAMTFQVQWHIKWWYKHKSLVTLCNISH